MNQASALSLLLCGFACHIGCSSEPSSGSRGSAGGPSGGNAASTAGSGGTSLAAGGNITPAGGNAPLAGTAGQGAGGSSMATAGAGGAVPPSGGAGGSSAGSGPGGASGAAGAGGTVSLPPLAECTTQPSIDRLTQWTASGEGTTVPATGSILVKEGANYVGKVQFVGAEWHVIPVLVANKFDATADFSKASGITLTYSATAELHVQLRSKSHWNGGDQYATTIPSTNGQVETHFFSFAEADWKSLFGAPVLSYSDTLKESMGLVFVGNSQNTVAFLGLRIDGYTPNCQ